MAAGRPQEQARKAGIKEGAGRTLAQVSSFVGGIALIALGVLGFFFGGAGFGIGDNVSGQDLVVFEVNGWHNIVHLATGGFLVLMAATAGSAVAGLLVFGLVYLAVTILGFLDGTDVLNVMPVNLADNVLHAVLAGLALLIALVSGALRRSARRTGR
ncbi:MAG TPA: DUF4383 domain-containing protein [Pseudonocardiaceae bacterium]|nr:DUF4383 domain-containing protein [Pseudonocardiaceae bacterium]